ncbi:synaptic vesicle 2-related protein isoform X2 [Nematostella vectensis]|uniref:synaptic vesicle 2-related protein isoform X2 n=1 Tax=Nematostella vectensis TaxID=45351 RepID=UPI00207714C9|nr:synaptic vesicle 2-related protein isoform X2 [Nematostella vectensis]
MQMLNLAEEKNYGTDEKGKTSPTFTVSDAVEASGYGWFQLRLGIICSFQWVADAMEITMLSILVSYVKCEWDLSIVQVAMITTVVFFMFLIGSPILGWLGDNLGRKPMLIVSSVAVAYAGLLSAFSPSYPWLLFLRGIVGFGLGGIGLNAALLTEYSPIKHRGATVLSLGVAWAIGSFMTSLVGMVFVPWLGWRSFVVAITFPLVVFLFLAKWVSESSHFYITSGEVEEAMKPLQDMARINKTEMPKGELKGLSHEVARGRIVDLFNTEYRVTTLLLSLTWFSVILSYYGMALLTTQMMTSGSNCPAMILTIFIIDKVRRKSLLTIYFAIASIFFCFLFICTGRIVSTLNLYIIRGITLAASEVLVCYTGEVYPTAFRATGLGYALGAGRIGGLITPLISQVLAASSLNAAIGVLFFFTALCTVTCYFLPIETRQLELQDE